MALQQQAGAAAAPPPPPPPPQGNAALWQAQQKELALAIQPLHTGLQEAENSWAELEGAFAAKLSEVEGLGRLHEEACGLQADIDRAAGEREGSPPPSLPCAWSLPTRRWSELEALKARLAEEQAAHRAAAEELAAVRGEAEQRADRVAADTAREVEAINAAREGLVARLAKAELAKEKAEAEGAAKGAEGGQQTLAALLREAQACGGDGRAVVERVGQLGARYASERLVASEAKAAVAETKAKAAEAKAAEAETKAAEAEAKAVEAEARAAAQLLFMGRYGAAAAPTDAALPADDQYKRATNRRRTVAPADAAASADGGGATQAAAAPASQQRPPRVATRRTRAAAAGAATDEQGTGSGSELPSPAADAGTSFAAGLQQQHVFALNLRDASCGGADAAKNGLEQLPAALNLGGAELPADKKRSLYSDLVGGMPRRCATFTATPIAARCWRRWPDVRARSGGKAESLWKLFDVRLLFLASQLGAPLAAAPAAYLSICRGQREGNRGQIAYLLHTDGLHQLAGGQLASYPQSAAAAIAGFGGFAAQARAAAAGAGRPPVLRAAFRLATCEDALPKEQHPTSNGWLEFAFEPVAGGGPERVAAIHVLKGGA
eukprot:scaffold11.g3977.t1